MASSNLSFWYFVLHNIEFSGNSTVNQEKIAKNVSNLFYGFLFLSFSIFHTFSNLKR
jgi:hypothetical protein